MPHDDIIAFSKVDDRDIVLTVCSLNPDHDVVSELHLDFDALGLDPDLPVQVTDELSGESFTWGASNFVKLYPSQPAHILKVTQ